MTERKFIESVQILRLKPGDVIVAEVDERHITPAMAEQLMEQLKERFPGHESIVTSKVRLRIQRPEAA